MSSEMTDVEENIIEDKVEEEEMDTILRHRVSLFDLSEDGNEWCERGIGQVSSCYVEKTNYTYLLVNSESDDSFLLKSKIEQETAYMKQDGRFIIWEENENTLGMSFQENAGCDDVWEIICQVQGKDPNVVLKPYIIKQEDIKEEEMIKEEGEEREKYQEDTFQTDEQEANDEVTENNTQTDDCFEEMLDIENVELSTFEKDILEQLIAIVNRLVSPGPDDKDPPPEERRFLDLFHISEDIEEDFTKVFRQLHGTILYLLSLNKDKQ